MSAPTAPIHLPPLTFLMSDHTTSSLAVDVAEALSEANNTLYVDDFLSPVYEGLQSMFSIDWKRDMANPRETQRLMLESASGDASENDIIVSLEKWFNETFGEAQLGKMGLHRMKTNREMFSYPYLFRDATPVHIAPFLSDPSIAKRDILLVNLNNPVPRSGYTGETSFSVTTLQWIVTPTFDEVLLAIEGACR